MITNPYSHIKSENRKQIIARISHEDHQLLTEVFGAGVFSFIITTTISNICNELRRNNVTPTAAVLDPDLRATALRILVDGVRRTNPPTPGQDSKPDERRGAKRPPRKAANANNNAARPDVRPDR